MRKFLYTIIAMLVCIVLLSRCNNAADTNGPDSTDSALPVEDLPPIDTTATSRPETIDPEPVQKSASVAYSYFKTIERNESKPVSVMLSINHPEAELRAILSAKEREEAINATAADTNSVASLKIELFDSVRVQLLDPDEDFKITSLQEVDKQRVDTLRGNRWNWTVQAKTDKPGATLVLVVTGYGKEGAIPLDNRRINIQVKLEGNMLRKLWTVFLDDTKNVVWLILVPVIAFFGKWRYELVKRRREK